MDTYRLRAHSVGDYSLLSLAHGGEPTFVDELLARQHRDHDARAFATVARKVAENGADWAIGQGVLKQLKGLRASIVVFELKTRVSTLRVATYVHDNKERTPVYLFAFTSHQGKSSSLPKSVKDRAAKLAFIAQDLMDKEEHNGNRKRN